jgi:predicted DCC family thiol-disulfide oxidoreductase YuxK
MGTPYSYRGDPAVPPFPDDRPIIVFDGHCVMCSWFARFVLRHDRRGVFRLLPAQTPLGEELYRHYRLDPLKYETNILIEAGEAWFRSEGSIRMAERLGWPWRIAAVLRVLPLPWRDAFYELIARNRFNLFGRRDICYLPPPGMEDRFLS